MELFLVLNPQFVPDIEFNTWKASDYDNTNT